MENYALFLLIKRLTVILSKADLSLIILPLFQSFLNKIIVLEDGVLGGKGMFLEAAYDREYAKALCQVCIYQGFYYHSWSMLMMKIKLRCPSRFSIYSLLRQELALARETTQQHNHLMLRYHLYLEEEE